MTARVSVNEYFARQYVVGKYNCFHFAVEVWRDLTGQDLAEKFGDAVKVGVECRRLSRKVVSGFIELPEPLDPCIVIFQVPKQAPHVGVYLRGRVLHIRGVGVRFQLLHDARLGIHKMRFIRPC